MNGPRPQGIRKGRYLDGETLAASRRMAGLSLAASVVVFMAAVCAVIGRN